MFINYTRYTWYRLYILVECYETGHRMIGITDDFGNFIELNFDMISEIMAFGICD